MLNFSSLLGFNCTCTIVYVLYLYAEKMGKIIHKKSAQLSSSVRPALPDEELTLLQQDLVLSVYSIIMCQNGTKVMFEH